MRSLPALKHRLSPTANGCLEWEGGRSNGYGVISIEGRRLRTHRVAWEIVNGPIPAGMIVGHRCDNPPCCNVAHLFLGTRQDNVDDCRAKGRHNLGERNGSRKLTAEQVLEIRRLYAAGDTTLRILASQFGVAFTTIHGIVQGREWAHLPKPPVPA